RERASPERATTNTPSASDPSVEVVPRGSDRHSRRVDSPLTTREAVSSRPSWPNGPTSRSALGESQLACSISRCEGASPAPSATCRSGTRDLLERQLGAHALAPPEQALVDRGHDLHVP